MPTIIDILRQDPEPLPDWLRAGPASFDRNEFFGSRTVYYPGSGGDGQPVRLCALSHAAHAFVYVDHGKLTTLGVGIFPPDGAARHRMTAGMAPLFNEKAPCQTGEYPCARSGGSQTTQTGSE